MLETWQDRLQAGYEEVSDRLAKLNRFLQNDENVGALSKLDAGLLIAQSYAMAQYLDILKTRLLRAECRVE